VGYDAIENMAIVSLFRENAVLKRYLIVMCFSVLAVSAALAQQTVPMTLKLADESSGPKVTLIFTQQNLSDVDPNCVVYDNVPGPDFTPGLVNKKVVQSVAEPHSAADNPSAATRVRTAALLELHAMRKNAVNLCMQLPKKYRTRWPQCAEIFIHEVRLESLANEKR
jgi:hypothetical protein